MAYLKAYGTWGQFLWFALGLFAAITIPAMAEAAFFPPLKPPPHSLPVELLVPAGCLFSALISAIFVGWIRIRQRSRRCECELPWPWPLLLGIVYCLVVFVSLPFVWQFADAWSPAEGSTRDGLGGVAEACTFVGLPILLGEIAFRIARRRMAPTTTGTTPCDAPPPAGF